MLENFNEDKRKNSMTQFFDFHTGWSIYQYSKIVNFTLKNTTPFCTEQKN